MTERSEPALYAVLMATGDPKTTESQNAAQASFNTAGAIPFVLCHLAVLGVFFTGVTLEAVICCLVLLVTRQWCITAGYHRYFSHRAFKTSRLFQFLLAFGGQTSGQKGALWWAAHHRVHHKLSDQPGDVHSPILHRWFYAHVGWIFDRKTEPTQWDKIRDLAKYPELVWLDKYFVVPPIVLGLATWAIVGTDAMWLGFFGSTVLLWHNTFMVNSVVHLFGKKRFAAGDESRNNFFVAITTLGEGWHNNHHYYQSSARNGFYWWEIDVTYYVLKMLCWVGVVWDLRPVPQRVLDLGRRLDAERRATPAASELVASEVEPSDLVPSELLVNDSALARDAA